MLVERVATGETISRKTLEKKKKEKKRESVHFCLLARCTHITCTYTEDSLSLSLGVSSFFF